MASFDRLLALAKKTGDRLIVFDSATNTGFAAIPIDEYEEMVSNPRDITSLSGDQLIEQINQDIGKWRESQEAEDDYLDMFGALDDSVEDDWQSAGDVLHDRYWDNISYDDDQQEAYPYTPFDGFYAAETPHANGLAFDFQDSSTKEMFPAAEDDFLRIEDIPRPIPPVESPAEGVWEEEPLDEDPIFFEEPV